jgi:stage II sporulation protein R
VEYLASMRFNNKKELIAYLQNNEDTIYKITNNVIKENGFDYDCSIEIGSSYYPQKKYKNLILPSGSYNGMKIKIGSSQGHNWWCVLFPPMCLIDSVTCELPSESEQILENSLPKETYNIISSSSPCYKFKFKIVDLINNLH